MTNGHHYIVCTTHRSGSYFFCETLRATGLLGRPLEYFSPQNEQTYCERLGARTYREYLDCLIEQASAVGSVFGAKIIHQDLDGFLDHLRAATAGADGGLSDAERLDALFPGVRFIWLTRRHKVRQAVSYARAFQTQAWAWHDQPVGEPYYDFDLLDSVLSRLALQESGWQEFFSDNGITPLTVVHEDFARSPEEVTLEVLDFLEVSRPSRLMTMDAGPMRQADGLSDEWARRFVSEKWARID